MNAFFNNVINSSQDIHTCKVGEVVNFNKENHSVDVIPLPSEDNAVVLNVPIVTMRTADFIVYYPFEVGDKVILIFADTDTENIKMGEDSAETERSHDITDCFCIGGFTLITDSLDIEDTDSLCIQTVNNSSSIVMTKDGDINIKCNNFKVEANRIDLN